MDKSNKNRTDLLAAGRKKLQQYRQKKDAKGSRSSGKSSKSEHDAVLTAEMSEKHHDIGATEASLDIGSTQDVVPTIDNDGADVRQSSKDCITGCTSTKTVAEPSNHGVNEDQLDRDMGQKGEEDMKILHENESSKAQGNSETVASGDYSTIPDIQEQADIIAEGERLKGEEQKGGDISAKQDDTSSEITTERVASAGESGELKNSIAYPGENREDAVMSSTVAVVGAKSLDIGGRSVVGKCSSESEGTINVISKVQDDEVNGATGYSEETDQVALGDGRVDAACCDLGYKVDDSVRPTSPGCSVLTLSSDSGICSISLSQLAKGIQRLDENAFRYLIESRHSPTEKLPITPSIGTIDVAVFEAVEKLKDHLYLASCAKDALQWQLAEQLEEERLLQQQFQKLVGDLSMSTASLVEARGNNEIISKDFTVCRSELVKFVSEKEELQIQLNGSMRQLEEHIAKVNELQNELDTSQENLVRVASELDGCRNAESVLLKETERLNSRVSLLTEEKNEVVNQNMKMVSELAQYKASMTSLQLENESLTKNLASLTEERRQIDEEKKILILEKDKLLSDLADCKGMVEALQVERTNLNEVLAAVQEDKKSIEEAKEQLVVENENLAAEVRSSSGSIETLQFEMSSIYGRLATLTDKINVVQDERDYLLNKNQSQSHELAETKVVISGLEAELNKTMEDLREGSLLIERLVQENVLLRTNLELHIAEIHQVEDTADGSCSKIDLPCHTPGTGESETAFKMLEKTSLESSVAIRPIPQPFQLSALEGLSEFDSWRRCLDDALEVFQKLEKAIESLHFHSASLNRTVNPVAPAVSKLIQAFELKTHADEQEISNLPSSEYLNTSDAYMLTKEQISHLKVVLGQLFLQMEGACKFLVAERKSRLLAEVNFAELQASYEYLRIHSDLLEEENIKNLVLSETLSQHVYDSAETVSELVLLCEASQKQQYHVTAENSQLRGSVSRVCAKIGEFQGRLDEICESSDEMVSSISSQVEVLLKEVTDTGSLLADEWNSFVAQIVEAVGKLEVSIEPLWSSDLSAELDNINGVGKRLVASIDGAKGAVEALQGELKAVQRHHEVTLSKYSELNDHFNSLKNENEKAVGMLVNIYRNLRQFVIVSCGSADATNTNLEHEKLLDPLDSGVFDVLMEKLGGFADEKMLLESVNNKLKSELVGHQSEINELKRRSLDSNTILRLCEDAERAFKLDSFDVHTFEPQSCLASLINILIQKYEEAEHQIKLSKDMSSLTEKCANGLPAELNDLSLLLMQVDVQNTVLKDGWKIVSDDVLALRVQLFEKISELEQSEQRVSSLRDKLGMAVTKGKGLVAQRDSLKQSLAESSCQLEQCSQELHSKNVRIHELEIKLKNYSEAGERMEALESELSYIRNSATALRESFLLKDSVLQRIEEILEDLELPEHFHSGGLIEKVDWLAKSVTRNTIPLTEWDQKSAFGGGSFPDSGFAVTDGWKEETTSSQNSVDELRRRYDELQSKFYGLAEQNEMLEHSLINCNNLLHRWEGILEKVNIPSQLRLSEPEDRMQWLGTALSEAQDSCISLQQRVDYFDTLCESLNGDLDASQKRITEQELAYESITLEKEFLMKNLETLNSQYDEILKKTTQLESEKENLLEEVSLLRESLSKEHERADGELIRLQGEIKVALQYADTNDLDFGSDSTECLERLLRKLIEEYKALALTRPVNVGASDEQVNEEECLTPFEGSNIDSSIDGVKDVAELRKNLEDALSELMHLKEERERYKENNQALICEVEELDLKKKELLELLNQEEQKSASLREKLNIAVKKGKSLVQQKDNMKQSIEELNSEIGHLKSQLSIHDTTIADYEHRISNLSVNLEKFEAAKSECIFLKDRLAEIELVLHEREHMLSMMLDVLKDIDVSVDFSSENPVEKLQAIGTRCHMLQTALDSSDKDLKKSRAAAELLLAELNEVQERNDNLQDEVEKVIRDHSEISQEILLSEAAKSEAVSELQKVSFARTKEREDHFAEVTALKSYVDQLKENLSMIDELVSGVLTNNMEILCNLEAIIKSCLGSALSPHMDVAQFSVPGGMISNKFINKIFVTELSSLKEQLCSHDNLSYAEAKRIAEVVHTIHREVASIRQASGARENHLMQLEAILKEKDSELFALRRNISLLYEACTISCMEIKKWKAQQLTDAASSSVKIHTSVDEDNVFDGETDLLSEEDVRAVTDKLILIVKDLISMKNEIALDSHKEMKTVISNLQKELHEKDIQRERISMEFVTQIKESEAAARNYLQDLQSAKAQVEDLRSQVILMEEERKALENRVEELENKETTFLEMQQRLPLLTDALALKEQENEALMQALDEEESQMEDMSMKIGELEKALKQKDKDLENVEALRDKSVKKLSITLRKFDELHKFSEGLLSEVEKLRFQLQERDEEISFLRQEVTRCTNESLTATQIVNKKISDEMHELLAWVEMMISRVHLPDLPFDDAKINQADDRKELLEKQLTYIVSELEELQVVTQNKDALLEVERVKVEELSRKADFLENLLRDKDSQLTLQKSLSDSGQATNTGSEIMEVESLINKRAASGTIATQVRSARKANSDQVAIAIDLDPSRLEEEDDDKAHGFKSLTKSKIVPIFTRPVSDMIDGLWVSCDRALMRQPALRLGLIMYWAIIHALLAAFVV